MCVCAPNVIELIETSDSGSPAGRLNWKLVVLTPGKTKMPTKRTKENDIVIPSASAPARRKSAAIPHAKHGAKRSPATTTSETETAVEVVTMDASYAPTEGEIAALAYTYWAGRGYQGGSPEEDWLRAEEELRAKATV
jgi:hypothetical protein